jgi:hypothetical protein
MGPLYKSNTYPENHPTIVLHTDKNTKSLILNKKKDPLWGPDYLMGPIPRAQPAKARDTMRRRVRDMTTSVIWDGLGRAMR